MRSLGMANFLETGIYALTAEKLSRGRTNLAVVEELLASGIKVLQYREKEKPMRAMYEECLAIRAMTRRAKATFIIDDCVDLALAVDADGVHIGQEDLPPQIVRQLIGPEKIIGLSTHNQQQYMQAKTMEIIDYVGVGPVYPTKTKKDVGAAVGLDYVRFVVNDGSLPFVAIGGINLSNITTVVEAGARTVAVVSDIVGDADISAKVRALQAIVKR